jgi:hypothetical protein
MLYRFCLPCFGRRSTASNTPSPEFPALVHELPLTPRVVVSVSNSQRELARTIFPHIKYVLSSALGSSPFLIKHVHFRSVNIKMWIKSETIPLLVEFLRALPNLTSLRIYDVHDKDILLLNSAFTNVSLPTVTAFPLPVDTHRHTCFELI